MPAAQALALGGVSAGVDFTLMMGSMMTHLKQQQAKGLGLPRTMAASTQINVLRVVRP
jgi:hypothetical protein